MKKTTVEILRTLGACARSIAWAERYPDPEKAWNVCSNIAWRFFVLERLKHPLTVQEGAKQHKAAHGQLSWEVLQEKREAIREVYDRKYAQVPWAEVQPLLRRYLAAQRRGHAAALTWAAQAR